jgi:xanthosine utilization system XapX-like protein
MGVSSSLIAGAIYYWITERHPIPALVIAGLGVVGILITYLFTKKPTPAVPSPSVHQDVKQEVSPQVNINPQFNIGAPAAAAPAPAPVPALQPKPEPRHNIKFADLAYGENEQTHVLSKFAGQTLSFATAKFVNEAIKGQELLAPTVKARAIYRRLDGAPVLDISNVPWVPGPGNQVYETFEVNTPKYLLLFSLGYNTRFARSVDSAVARVTGQRQMVHHPRDYEIKEPIANVEVQLLTAREQVYAVLLHFIDSDLRLLPYFNGYEEL